ncbi:MULTISPECIES: hypothetical protein [Bacillus cereus group]|uniref:hypothetical protein n=1 Tax=Bacillus cereus group TaxID=86661 RepID=UPI0008FE80C5|nr:MULTISPECIES: hypothetical protein [Bacillus cereus group]MDA1568743.1 hypothetical protein [Bacillus cereus]MDW8781994.1 hypothetical protein [Bacillus cereus]MDZ4557816.1 hypothetical protein [Bacillus cereus]OJE20308.1 hypothetical protein BAQ46_00640 [Bacillus paranthracis]
MVVNTLKKSEELRGILMNYFPVMENSSLSFNEPNIPDYDLDSHDFIKFAEYELEQISNEKDDMNKIHLINCISHLKRAIECQMDMCLQVLGLSKIVKKSNLGFDKKMEFFSKSGVFNSRSLTRLNGIRNKLEHSYEIPKITEIETYFDLTVAFVSVLDSIIIYRSSCVGAEFYIESDEFNELTHFSVEYIYNDVPKITCEINSFDREKMRPIVLKRIEVTAKEYEEFPYFLKVFLLLRRSEYTINMERALKDLSSI